MGATNTLRKDAPEDKQMSKQRSDPLVKLDLATISALAGFLQLPSNGKVTTEWMDAQYRQSSKLPRKLRRKLTKSVFFRLENDGPFCSGHFNMKRNLLKWCYEMLKKECSTRVTKIAEYYQYFPSECPTAVRDCLHRIIGINSLYLSEKTFQEQYYVPADYMFKRLGQRCPACVLSVVGGDQALLVALRANMIARSRREYPRLLRLVNAWMAALGPILEQNLKVESDALAAELKAVRECMKERDDKKKSTEPPEKKAERKQLSESRGQKMSSSHVGGEPARVRRDEDGNPLLPFKLTVGRNEAAGQTDVDTLFHRLHADVLVPAGINPELMSASTGTHGGTNEAVPGVSMRNHASSVPAQRSGGNEDFCHGYGSNRGGYQMPLASHRQRLVAEQPGDASSPFENASAVPEPLNLRTKPTANEQNRWSKFPDTTTERVTPCAASPLPSVPQYVPARSGWNPAKQEHSGDNVGAGNPFDVSSESSDEDRDEVANAMGPARDALSDDSDDEHGGELYNSADYTSRVESEPIAQGTAPALRTRPVSALDAAFDKTETYLNKVAPADGPSRLSNLPVPSSHKSGRIAKANAPCGNDGAVSSFYADAPPPSTGPPRVPFTNPFADPAPSKVQRCSEARPVSPGEYVMTQAEIEERFGYGNGVRPLSTREEVEAPPSPPPEIRRTSSQAHRPRIKPDDSISVVHARRERRQIEALRRQLKEARESPQGRSRARKLSNAETEWAQLYQEG